MEDELAVFIQKLGNVPRETVEKLDLYAERLKEWNEKVNLVAPSTLPTCRIRHFLDSAQLVPLLPSDKKVLVDLGSGAGFPGLVLAILTPHEVHLVESTGKKAAFLKQVATELELQVLVHNERIEALKGLKADIVTARALKALPELLAYAAPFCKKETLCLFLKGQKIDAELTEAHKKWMFEAEKKPSLSDPSGVILAIRGLKKKESPHGFRRK